MKRIKQQGMKISTILYGIILIITALIIGMIDTPFPWDIVSVLFLGIISELWFWKAFRDKNITPGDKKLCRFMMKLMFGIIITAVISILLLQNIRHN